MLSLIPFYALGNTPALSQNQLTSHPDIKGGAPTNGEIGNIIHQLRTDWHLPAEIPWDFRVTRQRIHPNHRHIQSKTGSICTQTTKEADSNHGNQMRND